MNLISLASIILFAILTVGCEKNNLASGDVQTEIPLLFNPIVTPDSVHLDNLTPTGGNYSVSTVVKVKMRFQGSSQTVVAKVLRPTTSDIVTSTTLRDDGIAPDIVANDSLYSGQIQFSVTRALAGRYRIQIVAQTPEGYQSNIIEKSFKLSRRNAMPKVENVSSPDSVNLPTTGFISVQFTAAVSDSDGLADIREVFFKRDTLSTKFFLRDDGGSTVNVFDTSATGAIRLSTGDIVAGDGTFSILLPVTTSNTRGTRILKFQAIDSFGDTSNIIQRSFTIR